MNLSIIYRLSPCAEYESRFRGAASPPLAIAPIKIRVTLVRFRAVSE